jgi:hypothetical protein
MSDEPFDKGLPISLSVSSPAGGPGGSNLSKIPFYVQLANIAASMATSREKKHLGWLDWFVIVLLTAVWIVTVYQVATAGIPAGLLKGFNMVMCLLLYPLIIWRTVKK